MKNRVCCCCIAFFSMIAIFSIVSYISFRSASTNTKSSKVRQNVVVSEENYKAVSADGMNTDRMNQNTKFTVQTYDLADSKYSDHVEALPVEYVGLSKSQLEEKLGEYTRNCSSEEKAKGLLYITIVSFSKDSVTVRKVYDNKENYKYYINIKDGVVVVYDNDKTTIVDDTGIEYKNLSEKQKQEVSQGVYIDDLSELYSALESYTS